METTKIVQKGTDKAKTGEIKKRISKTMKAAMKFKGAFDRDEVLNYVYSK